MNFFSLRLTCVHLPKRKALWIWSQEDARMFKPIAHGILDMARRTLLLNAVQANVNTSSLGHGKTFASGCFLVVADQREVDCWFSTVQTE